MKNDARVSRDKQGVEFSLDVAGLLVPALVRQEFLARFGASTDFDTWLPTFMRNRMEIAEAALQRFRADPDVDVVILRE